jgi:hypothetical protein
MIELLKVPSYDYLKLVDGFVHAQNIVEIVSRICNLQRHVVIRHGGEYAHS